MKVIIQITGVRPEEYYELVKRVKDLKQKPFPCHFWEIGDTLDMSFSPKEAEVLRDMGVMLDLTKGPLIE